MRSLSRCSAVASMLALSLALAQSAVAQTFGASLFYVDEVGDFWDYRVNGVQEGMSQRQLII